MKAVKVKYWGTFKKNLKGCLDSASPCILREKTANAYTIVIRQLSKIKTHL